MATIASNREKTSHRKYSKIVPDVLECVRELLQVDSPVTDDNQCLQRFCAKLEFLLQADMKVKTSRLTGTKKDYWDLIRECVSKSKGLGDGLKWVKSNNECKTALGRGRALIRFSLVHHRLADTLQHCLMCGNIISAWYEPTSIWLNFDLRSQIVSALYDLNDVTFDLSPHGQDLDNVWPSFSRTGSVVLNWRTRSRTSSMSSVVSVANSDMSTSMLDSSLMTEVSLDDLQDAHLTSSLQHDTLQQLDVPTDKNDRSAESTPINHDYLMNKNELSVPELISVPNELISVSNELISVTNELSVPELISAPNEVISVPNELISLPSEPISVINENSLIRKNNAISSTGNDVFTMKNDESLIHSEDAFCATITSDNASIKDDSLTQKNDCSHPQNMESLTADGIFETVVNDSTMTADYLTPNKESLNPKDDENISESDNLLISQNISPSETLSENIGSEMSNNAIETSDNVLKCCSASMPEYEQKTTEDILKAESDYYMKPKHETGISDDSVQTRQSDSSINTEYELKRSEGIHNDPDSVNLLASQKDENVENSVDIENDDNVAMTPNMDNLNVDIKNHDCDVSPKVDQNLMLSTKNHDDVTSKMTEKLTSVKNRVYNAAFGASNSKNNENLTLSVKSEDYKKQLEEARNRVEELETENKRLSENVLTLQGIHLDLERSVSVLSQERIRDMNEIVNLEEDMGDRKINLQILDSVKKQLAICEGEVCVLSEKIVGLEREKESLERRVEDGNCENVKLTEEFDGLCHEKTSLLDKIGCLETQMNEVSKENEKFMHIEQENARLVKCLDDVNCDKEKLQEKFDGLCHEKTSLLDKNVCLETQMNDLSKENEKFMHIEQENARLAKRLDDVNLEKKKLKEKFDNFSHEKASLLDKLGCLETQLTNASKENEKLKDFEHENARLVKCLDNVKSEKEKLQEKFDGLKSEKTLLLDKIGCLETQVNGLSKENEKFMHIEQEKVHLVKSLDDVNFENEKLQDKFDCLKTENDTSLDKIGCLETKLQGVMKENEKIVDLNVSLEEVNSANAKLQENLDSLSSENVALTEKIGRFEKEISSEYEKVMVLERDNRLLNIKIDEQNGDNTKLQQKYDCLTHENSTSLDMIKCLDTRILDLTTENEKLVPLEDDKSRLEKCLEDVSSEKAELLEQHDGLKHEKVDLCHKLESIGIQLKEIAKENEKILELENDKTLLGNNLSEVNSTNEKLRVNFDSLSSEKATLLDKIGCLVADLKDVRKENEKIVSLEHANSQLEINLNDVNSENAKLQEKYDSLSSENASLADTIDTLETELNKITCDNSFIIEELKEQIQKLTENILKSDNDIVKLSAENDQIKWDVNVLLTDWKNELLRINDNLHKCTDFINTHDLDSTMMTIHVPFSSLESATSDTLMRDSNENVSLSEMYDANTDTHPLTDKSISDSHTHVPLGNGICDTNTPTLPLSDSNIEHVPLSNDGVCNTASGSVPLSDEPIQREKLLFQDTELSNTINSISNLFTEISKTGCFLISHLERNLKSAIAVVQTDKTNSYTDNNRDIPNNQSDNRLSDLTKLVENDIQVPTQFNDNETVIEQRENKEFDFDGQEKNSKPETNNDICEKQVENATENVHDNVGIDDVKESDITNNSQKLDNLQTSSDVHILSNLQDSSDVQNTSDLQKQSHVPNPSDTHSVIDLHQRNSDLIIDSDSKSEQISDLSKSLEKSQDKIEEYEHKIQIYQTDIRDLKSDIDENITMAGEKEAIFDLRLEERDERLRQLLDVNSCLQDKIDVMTSNIVDFCDDLEHLSKDEIAEKFYQVLNSLGDSGRRLRSSSCSLFDGDLISDSDMNLSDRTKQESPKLEKSLKIISGNLSTGKMKTDNAKARVTFNFDIDIGDKSGFDSNDVSADTLTLSIDNDGMTAELLDNVNPDVINLNKSDVDGGETEDIVTEHSMTSSGNADDDTNICHSDDSNIISHLSSDGDNIDVSDLDNDSKNENILNSTTKSTNSESSTEAHSTPTSSHNTPLVNLASNADRHYTPEEVDLQLTEYKNNYDNLVETLNSEINGLRFELSTSQMQQQLAFTNIDSQKAEIVAMVKRLSRQQDFIDGLEVEMRELKRTRETEMACQKNEIEQLKAALFNTEDEKVKAVLKREEMSDTLEVEQARSASIQREYDGQRERSDTLLSNRDDELHELRSDTVQLKRKLVKLLREKDALWHKTDSLVHERRLQAAEKWMSDTDVVYCMGCTAEFTFTIRRHHCRLCGKIYCSNCCNNWVLTTHSSKKSRVCNSCYVRQGVPDSTSFDCTDESGDEESVCPSVCPSMASAQIGSDTSQSVLKMLESHEKFSKISNVKMLAHLTSSDPRLTPLSPSLSDPNSPPLPQPNGWNETDDNKFNRLGFNRDVQDTAQQSPVQSAFSQAETDQSGLPIDTTIQSPADISSHNQSDLGIHAKDYENLSKTSGSKLTNSMQNTPVSTNSTSKQKQEHRAFKSTKQSTNTKSNKQNTQSTNKSKTSKSSKQINPSNNTTHPANQSYHQNNTTNQSTNTTETPVDQSVSVTQTSDTDTLVSQSNSLTQTTTVQSSVPIPGASQHPNVPEEDLAESEDGFAVISDDEIARSLTLSGSSFHGPESSVIISAELLSQGTITSEISLAPGHTFSLPIAITTPGDMLCWRFTSQPKDVGFGAIYTKDETTPPDDALVLVAPCKCNAHKQTVKGELTAKKRGIYTLQFDNTISKLTTKLVSYSLHVEKAT